MKLNIVNFCLLIMASFLSGMIISILVPPPFTPFAIVVNGFLWGILSDIYFPIIDFD